MDDYKPVYIDDEKKVDEDLVLESNLFYDSSEVCEYVMPVAETPNLPYSMLDDCKDPKNTYRNIEYVV